MIKIKFRRKFDQQFLVNTTVIHQQNNISFYYGILITSSVSFIPPTNRGTYKFNFRAFPLQELCYRDYSHPGKLMIDVLHNAKSRGILKKVFFESEDIEMVIFCVFYIGERIIFRLKNQFTYKCHQ